MKSNWASKKVMALLDSKVKVEKPITEAKKEKIRQAYLATTQVYGWNHYNLLDALKRRDCAEHAYFVDGIAFIGHVPGQKRRLGGHMKTQVVMKLADNAKSFSVFLSVHCYLDEVQLHKPIVVPVVETTRKMADALARACDALVYGIHQVIGEENLPGWPSKDDIERMRQYAEAAATNALKAFDKANEEGRLQ